LAVSGTVVLSGCGDDGARYDAEHRPDDDQLIAAEVLRHVDLVGVVWSESDTLLGFQVGSDHRPHLVSVAISKGRARPLTLPDEAVLVGARDDWVSGWEYTGTPVALADGRFALRRRYFDVTTAPGERTEYVAVDLTANTAEPILSFSHTSFPELLLSSFVWNGDLTEAYAVLRHPRDDECSTIVRVTKAGIEPLELRVGDAGDSWDLGLAATAMNGSECDRETGTAWLSLSMDREARTVVFFAAAPSARRRAASVTRQTVGNIFLTQFGARTARELVSDVIVGGFAISPDGSRLAWNGRTEDGTWGCWILDLSRDETTLVSRDIFTQLVWSPGGRDLAALTIGGDVVIFRAPN
jgi:hypothetical protein